MINNVELKFQLGTQEEAAEAYDIAAIKFRGLNAVTNFDMSRYDVKSIANSNLPIGGINGKSKNSSESASDSKSLDGSRSDDTRDNISSASSVAFASHHPAATAAAATSTLSFAIPIKQDTSDYWSNILGYNQNTNARNLTMTPTLFPCTTFQNPSTFHMDFSVNSSVNESNNNGVIMDGGLYVDHHLHHHQQQNGTATTTSSATNIALNSSNGNSYNESGGGGGYGSWNIAQNLHSLQAAKANLSVFQTPIFGME